MPITMSTNYTGIEDLTDTGIAGLLSYPSSASPYFWLYIIMAIFIILTSVLFFEERRRLGKANLLSSLAVSSLATIVVTWAGTLVGFITNEVSLIVSVFGMIFIVIWFFKRD